MCMDVDAKFVLFVSFVFNAIFRVVYVEHEFSEYPECI